MSQKSDLLSHASPKIGGLLLAGGRGRRFDPTGQQQKLLARLPGRETLITTSARRLLPWVDTLTVVVGVHSAGLVRELAGMAIEVLVCPDADLGPGATLRHGLFRASASDTGVKGYLIGLADMPYISPQTYQRMRDCLIEGISRDKAGIWRPTFNASPGHPVAVSAALVERYLAIKTRDFEPAKGLASLWGHDRSVLREIPVDDAGCVMDIDRPQDLV